MSDEFDVVKQISNTGSPVVAALALAWATLSKLLLGRTIKALDRNTEAMNDLSERVSHIEGALGITPRNT